MFCCFRFFTSSSVIILISLVYAKAINFLFIIAPFYIFYVSGYCCRSLVKGNKCDSCKGTTVALVDIKFDAEINTFIPVNVSQFFNDINRGGLWKPNEQTFCVGTLCWQVFTELSVSKNKLQQQCLPSLNQQRVFQEIVNVIFYENFAGYALSFSTMCAKGHDVLEEISGHFLNS